MVNRCIICGVEFESAHKTSVCENCRIAKCKVCGNEFELKWPYTANTCSSKCRGIYRKLSGSGKQSYLKSQSTLKSKGFNNLREVQTSKTYTKVCKYCKKPFVTSNPRQEYCEDIHYGKCPVCGRVIPIHDMSVGPQACSDECRIKRIQSTCMSRYGDPTAVNSVHSRILAKQTCLNKYGVDHYSKSSDYKEKYTKTMIDKYGTTVPLRSDMILDKLRNTCLQRYGVPYACMRPECRSSYRTISKINQEFSEKLHDAGLDSILEFSLDRFSYDIKVNNILIEINPSITHNSYINIFPNCDPLDSKYHMNKTDVAEKNGYRCIHVFDWDDWSKIVELITPKNVIYARSCEVHQIDKKSADDFTSSHHLSGRCKGQYFNYGLFYNDELVQVMTFGSPRYNKKYDFELLRLCSRSDVHVSGGASKLFKKFLEDHKNEHFSVISYCDRSKFSGDVYPKLGMTLLRITEPAKIWSKGSKKVTDNLLRSRGYDQLFGTSYGKFTSNEQLMIDNGWLPVYDCGQKVFEYLV